MANVQNRRVVVVHPRVDEASSGNAGANGTAHRDGAKTASETTQAQKPWPVEFGWDFPFNSPKPNSMTEDGKGGSRPPFPPVCAIVKLREKAKLFTVPGSGRRRSQDTQDRKAP